MIDPNSKDPTLLYYLLQAEAAEYQRKKQLEQVSLSSRYYSTPTIEVRVSETRGNYLRQWLPEITPERSWTVLMSATTGVFMFAIASYLGVFGKTPQT